MLRAIFVLLVLALPYGMPPAAQAASDARLLRERYRSEVTGTEREYYVFLPEGYGADPERRWPLILFLHGAGERGDGRADLEKVLAHGPLMEAWIQRRDLPFVMIVPQAPYPDGRANTSVSPPGFVEKRDTSAARPPRPEPFADTAPIPEDWGPLRERSSGTPVNPWLRMEKELVALVENTARTYRVDRTRIYLTGISMGGFGAFGIAAVHPDLFAAVAPICGGGDPATLDALASSQRPLWIIHGGRDRIVAPIESLRMANALLAKGHRAARFTVHHDLDHDVWIRVYAGEDFYAWLLDQSLPGVERASDLPR
jgi:predicted peptidase